MHETQQQGYMHLSSVHGKFATHSYTLVCLALQTLIIYLLILANLCIRVPFILPL